MLTIKFKVISQMRSYTNQASSLLPESRQKNSERDHVSNQEIYFTLNRNLTTQEILYIPPVSLLPESRQKKNPKVFGL